MKTYALNDPKLLLTQEQKRACISLYQQFYAKEKGIDFRKEDADELFDKIQEHAIPIRVINSVAWILQNPRPDLQDRLVFFSHVIGSYN